MILGWDARPDDNFERPENFSFLCSGTGKGVLLFSNIYKFFCPLLLCWVWRDQSALNIRFSIWAPDSGRVPPRQPPDYPWRPAELFFVLRVVAVSQPSKRTSCFTGLGDFWAFWDQGSTCAIGHRNWLDLARGEPFWEEHVFVVPGFQGRFGLFEGLWQIRSWTLRLRRRRLESWGTCWVKNFRHCFKG